MLTESLILPDEPCMFTGYRNAEHNSAPDIYQTLTHWVESEKFRESDEAIRQAVLNAPSPAEARKLAKANDTKVRNDWRLTKAKVLIAGVLMAADQDPSIATRLKALARLTSLELGMECPAGKTIGGMLLSWYAGSMWEAADALINRPVTILVAAARTAKISDPHSQIRKFLGKERATHVLVPLAKDVATIGESFAVANWLPVKYVPIRGKLRAKDATGLAMQASNVLVFETKGSKQFDALISASKGFQKTCKLSLI